MKFFLNNRNIMNLLYTTARWDRWENINLLAPTQSAVTCPGNHFWKFIQIFYNSPTNIENKESLNLKNIQD